MKIEDFISEAWIYYVIPACAFCFCMGVLIGGRMMKAAIKSIREKA